MLNYILSQDKFKEILDAYKTLSDENLRRKYDNQESDNSFGQNNQNNGDFNPHGHGRGDFNSNGRAYRRSYTFYQGKPKKKNNDFDYDNSY